MLVGGTRHKCGCLALDYLDLSVDAWRILPVASILYLPSPRSVTVLPPLVRIIVVSLDGEVAQAVGCVHENVERVCAAVVVDGLKRMFVLTTHWKHFHFMHCGYV